MIAWIVLEAIALALGFVVGLLLSLSQVSPFVLALTYGLATLASIAAGALIKSVAQSPDEMKRLNDRFHKWAVVTLNGSVGAGCAAYLWQNQSMVAVPLSILVVAGFLYVASWATGLVQPHSFWARFRSALVRVVLISAIVGTIWPWGYLAVPLAAAPVLVLVWRHLRQDQAKYGWADR